MFGRNRVYLTSHKGKTSSTGMEGDSSSFLEFDRASMFPLAGFWRLEVSLRSDLHYGFLDLDRVSRDSHGNFFVLYHTDDSSESGSPGMTFNHLLAIGRPGVIREAEVKNNHQPVARGPGHDVYAYSFEGQNGTLGVPWDHKQSLVHTPNGEESETLQRYAIVRERG